jgi:ribosome-interacting GTPase 1
MRSEVQEFKGSRLKQELNAFKTFKTFNRYAAFKPSKKTTSVACADGSNKIRRAGAAAEARTGSCAVAIMPANLTPEYKAAQDAFRKARDPRERLDALREMLRVIPKHKGTDHLQGDIKRRIKELSEELERPKKSGARGGPPLVVQPEGAAQIALLGPPNTGKSSLHARLTGSGAQAAPYPFTTKYPEPGMMSYEDIHFQLVDLPAISPEHPFSWLASALQTADACLLVVDLGEPACVERVDALHRLLREKRVTLTDLPEQERESAKTVGEDDEDPFALRIPAVLLANRADLLPSLNEELRAFLELTGLRYRALTVSATTGQGLDEIGPLLFRYLGIVRVYTKAPGRPADRNRPFTLRRGQTVEDIARLVHRDLARSLKYARVWGKSGFDGQHVGRNHPLADGDVVELHA